VWRELLGTRRRPQFRIGTLRGEMVTNEFTLTQTQTQPSPGTLAFADADGCSAWLRAVPLTNIPRYNETILGQLKRLGEVDFAPRERARIAEIMREPVMFLHTELARRYAGKPQPASERENEAAEQALALWNALWSQYSACLKPLLEGDLELQNVKAKVLQRGLWVGKQLMLVYGLARRLPAPAVWQELHAYYRLAEILDCAVTAVSDELMPNAVGVSCYSTYCHALLLDLADPCAMTVRQIELTDRWLSMWARKVFPYAEQRETEGPLIVIDLEAPMGAVLLPAGARNAGETTRYGYPAKLITSVRGRLKRLASGSNPAELQLGHDAAVEACTALLTYLDSRWYALPAKRTGGDANATVDLCVGGLGAAYFRISGRTFNSADMLGRLSYQGTQHLATLGALTDYDRNKEEAEKSWAWESWQGDYDWTAGTLRRVGSGHHRWHLDQLVVLRGDDRIRCGYVTRVALDNQGELAISLKLWPGSATAIAVRALTTMLVEEPPAPALTLAATPDEKACVIVPPRTFSAGRVLRSLASSPERRLRMTRLIQRGADFERASFEEVSA
jgi:cyclic-di-GMP-binding protein